MKEMKILRHADDALLIAENGDDPQRATHTCSVSENVSHSRRPETYDNISHEDAFNRNFNILEQT
jgi:hypothetical protein